MRCPGRHFTSEPPGPFTKAPCPMRSPVRASASCHHHSTCQPTRTAVTSPVCTIPLPAMPRRRAQPCALTMGRRTDTPTHTESNVGPSPPVEYGSPQLSLFICFLLRRCLSARQTARGMPQPPPAPRAPPRPPHTQRTAWSVTHTHTYIFGRTHPSCPAAYSRPA